MHPCFQIPNRVLRSKALRRRKLELRLAEESTCCQFYVEKITSNILLVLLYNLMKVCYALEHMCRSAEALTICKVLYNRLATTWYLDGKHSSIVGSKPLSQSCRRNLNLASAFRAVWA